MKVFFVGALALLSMNVFAQYTPAQVCQEISRWSSSSGASCAQAISRGRFDNSALEVGFTVASNGNYDAATRIMSLSANRYLDDNIARSCIAIAHWSGNSAAQCVDVALDNAFEPALADVATAIGENGNYTAAVTAVQNARNGAASPGAAEVCKAVARWSGSSAADCITAIINKDYFNGSESVCMTLAQNGSYTNAVTCMRNSGIETRRRPGRRGQGGYDNGGRTQPRLITISQEALIELKRNISKARAQYDRNMIRQLGTTLIDLERSIDDIAR